jgi:hypothetical protein
MPFGHNGRMSSKAPLTILASEADSLLDQAKKYRAELEALGPDDSRRAVYETIIRDLLERSRRLSSAVTLTAKSS